MASSLLRRLHRWLGLVLTALLVPVALSGALLVWYDEIDRLAHPARYAVTGDAAMLTPDDYLARAARALGQDFELNALRFPRETGFPIEVTARQRAEAGRRPRIFIAFIDPPTGDVLDTMDFRASLLGALHVFHENLTIPEYSGRAIVGWVGVVMLTLSLTGIWLWWPRGALLSALRWRRSPRTASNLHHLVGFCLAIPLAVVSATGIYLAFPPFARSVMSSLAPMAPQQARPGFGSRLQEPQLAAARALELALALAPGTRPAALFPPVIAPGPSGARPRNEPAWRVQLRGEGDDIVTVMVDDRRGAAVRQPDPLSGDRAAQWIRWVHEGSRGGAAWRVALFLTGLGPLVFVVTGAMVWWHGRRRFRISAKANKPAELRPAE
jgi:uncharacterized iron-regulated membrane protein